MPTPSDPERRRLKRALKEEGLRLGFDAIGIARAERLSAEARRLETWLGDGMHGTMGWMERNVDKRVDPRELVPGARTVISVLENYYHAVEPPTSDRVARVSRYARGADYHTVIRKRLKSLLAWLDVEAGGVSGRVFVDSAPIMDKAWAARAGLGWIGKHTNLINRHIGSWFFIGELIVDVDLEPDSPVADMCGTCTRCIEACPTGAIVEPYRLDGRKCISYLTIEHHEDDIDPELQRLTGRWIFGCDVCQEVCPWNKFAKASDRHEYAPGPATADEVPETWLQLSESEFHDRFQESPIKRTGWHGLRRNARIAAENNARTEISEEDAK